MTLKEQLAKQIENTDRSFKSAGSAGNEGVVQAVFVPVEVQKDGGKLRLYLEVSPEAVESAEMLDATLNEIEKNFDLAIWRTKSYQNNNGGGFKKNSWNSRRY